MTAIQAKTERKRQDNSAQGAEKRRSWANTPRQPGRIRSVPAACAIEDAGWTEKGLSSGQNQADLHLSQHATWGMSVEER
jgi:hypothetical protein